jgi:plasmid maintenance system antidote protein VapI
MSTVELVRILNIGQSAISRLVQRGEKITETEDFAHQFKKII